MVDLKSVHSRLLGSRAMTGTQLSMMDRMEGEQPLSLETMANLLNLEFLFPYLHSWGSTALTLQGSQWLN